MTRSPALVRSSPRDRLRSLLLAGVFYGLVAWFIAHFLTKSLSSELLIWMTSPIVIATLASWILCRHLMALTWKTLLDDVSRGTCVSDEVISVYAKSLLGRYIPGKVFTLALRASACQRLGVSLTQVLGTSVAETLINVAAAATVGISLVLLSGSLGLVLQIAGLMVPLAVAWLMQNVVAGPLKLAQSISRLGPKWMSLFGWSHYVTVIAVRRAILLALLAQALSSLGFLAWALRANHSIGWIAGLQIAGSFPLAGIAGMLAFTPAGIGVREAVQFPLIAGVFDTNEIMILIVGARLLDIASDLIYLTLTWLRQVNGRASI